MPLRTVSNTGGNWNATTAWAGGVVPIAGDTVDFTATSGNLVVNVSTANLVGIDFTNYVGTITFNANINTNGTVNLGTGGYTQLGASGLNLNGTATITSNGTVWSRPLVFTGTSITYTLADNLSTTGTVSLSGTTTSILNGNSLNIGGSLTSTTAAITSGTTTIVFNGTGTWSNTSTGPLRNNLNINTAGTLTISGSVRYDTGTLTYTTGSVIVTGSNLIIGTSTTFNTNNLAWNNVFVITTATLTLSSSFIVEGTLSFTVGTLSFAGAGILSLGNLIIGSNVDQNASAIINLPNPISLNTLTLQGHFFNSIAWGSVINNHSITVLKDLDCQNNDGTNVPYPCSGTATIILKSSNGRILGPTIGTGYVSMSNNLIIDGNYTVTNYFNYITGTLTGKSGSIKHANAASIFYISTCTLRNINNVLFDKITALASNTLTMNQFFSGSPSVRTLLQSSVTGTNFTVTFQDGFEKFCKFVNIKNCTITRRGQLISLTDIREKGNNIGIRYYNQFPNSLPKNSSLVQPSLTFDTGGIIPDPNFVKLK